jgi:hypothetical protein
VRSTPHHAADPGHLAFLLALTDAGLTLNETVIWLEDRFALGHSDYHYRNEPILHRCREVGLHLPPIGRLRKRAQPPGRGWARRRDVRGFVRENSQRLLKIAVEGRDGRSSLRLSPDRQREI